MPPKQKYTLLDRRSVYQANFQGGKYPFIRPIEKRLKYWDYETYDHPLETPYAFNSVIIKNGYQLASGDLPRFAFNFTAPDPSANPAIRKLGDLRLRLKFTGQQHWLDEIGEYNVQYHPWGTIHDIAIPEHQITLSVTAALYQDQAIVITVTLKTAPEPVTIDGIFGGMTNGSAHWGSEIINTSDEDGRHNQICAFRNQYLCITDPEAPHRIIAGGQGLNASIIINEAQSPRCCFRAELATGDAWTFKACRDQWIDLCPELMIQSAQDYYTGLLESVAIETPDALIDAGFYAAVFNMDYIYNDPAWKEGIHGWNSYWTNNYQISAALYLGQVARAKRAIMAYCNMEHGPGAAMRADGSPFDANQDGLPYLIIQLQRYWQITGDRQLLETVWPRFKTALERFLRERDPEGDGLLNFHQGCNQFMYQADHLRLPGNALSPSAMAAGMLDAMAELGQVMNDDQVQQWQNRANYIRREILHRFWLPEEGRFVAAFDFQGRKQQAAYYTDYVFPGLYGGFQDSAWNLLCLHALQRDLWVGDDLCRVGNYMPPVFGNNAVQHAQMAETAEALLKAGMREQGMKLLHGTARGATVYTDSPGAFPEYGSDSGYGLTNYLFGNPIGAYVVAIVQGLFGWTPQGAICTWRPAIPADWEHASLQLPEVTLNIKGQAHDRVYRITHSSPTKLNLSIPLDGQDLHILEATEGPLLNQSVKVAAGGNWLVLDLDSATAHEIHVTTTIRTEDAPIKQDQHRLEAPLPDGNWTLLDPQQLVTQWEATNGKLKAKFNKPASDARFFMVDEANQRSREFRIPAPPAAPAPQQLTIAGERKALNLNPHFNSESLIGRSAWHFTELNIDLSHVVETCTKATTGHRVTIEDLAFDVIPQGRNLIQLAHAMTNGESLHIAPCTCPATITIPLPATTVQGLDLMLLCEAMPNYSFMEVGQLTLHYANASDQVIPLIYGEWLDSHRRTFSPVVRKRKIADDHAWVAACTLPARRQDHPIHAITFNIDTPDVNIAIMGINLIPTC